MPKSRDSYRDFDWRNNPVPPSPQGNIPTRSAPYPNPTHRPRWTHLEAPPASAGLSEGFSHLAIDRNSGAPLAPPPGSAGLSGPFAELSVQEPQVHSPPAPRPMPKRAPHYHDYGPPKTRRKGPAAPHEYRYHPRSDPPIFRKSESGSHTPETRRVEDDFDGLLAQMS